MTAPENTRERLAEALIDWWERESGEEVRAVEATTEVARQYADALLPLIDTLLREQAEGISAARAAAAEVRKLRAERDAVIEAVRAIHSQDESVLAAGAWCPVDGDEAPCRTLRAMHDALAGLIGGDRG